MRKDKINKLKTLIQKKGNVSNMPIGDNSKPWTMLMINEGSDVYYDSKKQYTKQEVEDLEKKFNLIEVTIVRGNSKL